MRAITLLQPGRIVLGSGCSLQCVEDVLALRFDRIFIVTSPPVVELIEPAIEAFKRSRVSVTIFAEIASEPDIGVFQQALRLAKAQKPDAVIGVGGGSALDVAKLVAALYNSDQNVKDVFGINNLASRKTYLACLPTTSGTGSEVSPNAILLDEGDQLKKGVVSPHLVPDAAYVDARLTLTVPPAVTAATGMDALTHCIEAYANRHAHPVIDLYALEGIGLISAHLERAVRNGRDLEARSNMALGSLYGGLCLGPVNTAAVHALAYPLGGEFHTPHGISNAVLLPHVLAFNIEGAPERYADIALAMGIERGNSDLHTARQGLEAIRDLSRRCGIPGKLSEVGIPAEAIPRMARAAMTVTRLLKNNLRELTVADAESIYRAAY